MSNLCNFEDISKAILKTPDSAIKWLETLCGENVKWKHTANANQMVVRTDNYYYKVYAYNEVDKFNSLIRHAFAQVYQSYGIKWDIITVKTESGYIDVERREKLETCKEWSDDILINYSDTLDLVEEKLNFESIKNEIKKQYKFINKLKLVRQCVNRPKDYAIYDNKIILLDDADWHLVMLDFYNRPIGMSNIFVKVKVFDEYYTFTSLIINPQRVLTIESVYDFRDKFFLFKDLELIKRNASLRQEFHNMIKDNINLLIHKETKQYNSERKELCSIFKKTFYCTDNYDGIDFNTYNKIALNINDINNNKSIWDMACYYYTNQDICAIDLYSSLYSNIDYLCNLLDEAKICAVDPIAGFEKNTGIFIYTQFNILNDNNVLNNNIEYLKKHYPDIKIIINVILNEPFLSKFVNKEVTEIPYKNNDMVHDVYFGTKDDTKEEFYPKRKTFLKFLDMFLLDSDNYLKIFRADFDFNKEINKCGHNKNNYLPYIDSNKCCICDWGTVGNIL